MALLDEPVASPDLQPRDRLVDTFGPYVVTAAPVAGDDSGSVLVGLEHSDELVRFAADAEWRVDRPDD